MSEFPAVRDSRDWAGGAFLAGVLIVALGALPFAASAQGLKRYLTPDGRTVYSDKPVPGAKLVGEVAAPPPQDPAALEAARYRESVRAAEANRLAEKRVQERADERKRLEAATADLERARQKLNEGRAPKPGERIGTAGGGSRFTDEYLARQQANEEAVKRAEEELQKAQGR